MRPFLVFIVALMLIGCSNDFREIPAGHIGKKLMPSGWDSKVMEAGQIDIGVKNPDGSYTTLVLLEATSVSIKEMFATADANRQDDDRILIGKTPVSVDVYLRMIVSQDPETRTSIFAQMTPQGVGDRVSKITVASIYKQFAQMDVRSGIRSVLQKESDVYKITKNIEFFNDSLARVMLKLFEKTGVPLELQNVAISNVKVDESVWAAENAKAAALANVEAINQVGAALKANPGYLQVIKYETYKSIKDKVGSFTIIDGSPGGVVIGK